MAAKIRKGDKVTTDLVAANRDTSVFGDDPDSFDPHRELPPGVAPWGLSFGLGMHACIGQTLAAGVDPMGKAPEHDHLFGLVPVAITATLAGGARPDPEKPAELDPTSTRGYWGTYPVLMG